MFPPIGAADGGCDTHGTTPMPYVAVAPARLAPVTWLSRGEMSSAPAAMPCPAGFAHHVVGGGNTVADSQGEGIGA
ncbi:hypothetical protein ACFXEL_22055 [Streptomyces sp. NPDC059382]|uniref:hypothetical protein n=1 Tax=Streptomyces sp. NPDC059382 TaxID=3346816 RepID=UPI00367A2F1E